MKNLAKLEQSSILDVLQTRVQQNTNTNCSPKNLTKLERSSSSSILSDQGRTEGIALCKKRNHLTLYNTYGLDRRRKNVDRRLEEASRCSHDDCSESEILFSKEQMEHHNKSEHEEPKGYAVLAASTLETSWGFSTI